MKTRIKKIGIIPAIALSVVLLNSCATSSTVITGSWESPGNEESYANIVVAALVPTISTRSSIEQKMATSLQEEGVEASQSTDVLPPRYIEERDKKQEILDAIRNNGTDGILTVSLIDQETETRYVPGAETYAPYPYYGFYGTFWGYYSYWSPRFYEPGYYESQKIYFIETNLYDAETENLIWSAQSKTYEPVDLENFSRDFANAIVEQLVEDGVISAGS